MSECFAGYLYSIRGIKLLIGQDEDATFSLTFSNGEVAKEYWRKIFLETISLSPYSNVDEPAKDVKCNPCMYPP